MAYSRYDADDLNDIINCISSMIEEYVDNKVDKELSDIKDENDSLREWLKDSAEDENLKNREITELNCTISRLESKIYDMQNIIEDLESENYRLTKEVCDLESSLR